MISNARLPAANKPADWMARLPHHPADTHKYARGHVAVFSGGPSATGAARLAAEAAMRTGAGAVTVLSPPSALLVNAAHLTAVMVRRLDKPEEIGAFIEDRKVRAVVCGPGFGAGADQQVMLDALLTATARLDIHLVLDADALTMIAEREDLRAQLGALKSPPVLTPHEGEFARLFPDLVGQDLSKFERAAEAAGRLASTVVYKGSETVIADPNGRLASNTNGSPWLATAGSGDVLAGVVASLLAQRMPRFEAACAAVWCHAEAGTREGFGLSAEDLPQAIRRVMAALMARQPSGAR